MDRRAIGVFDSGLGGLTAVRELRRRLPQEDIVYFGDTGRVPYGTRSRETIARYALQDTRFLVSHDVKLVVIACGTASSAVSPETMAAFPLPWTGVIRPTAEAAVRASRSGRIGILGTAATIHSGSFQRMLHTLRPEAELTAQAGTLLVPLVEAGWTDDRYPAARMVLETYLRPLRAAGVDTLILGCTHYPLLRPMIAQLMGDAVTLIDSGEATAAHTAELLTRFGLEGDPTHRGTSRFYVSDTVDRFTEIASAFLGADITGRVEQVDIESY